MILTMCLLSLHNTILFLLLFTSTILIDSMHQVMAMDVDPSQASSSSSSLLNEQEPSPQQQQYPDDQQDQGFYEEIEDERTLLDVFADNVGDILAHHMVCFLITLVFVTHYVRSFIHLSHHETFLKHPKTIHPIFACMHVYMNSFMNENRYHQQMQNANGIGVMRAVSLFANVPISLS